MTLNHPAALASHKKAKFSWRESVCVCARADGADLNVEVRLQQNCLFSLQRQTGHLAFLANARWAGPLLAQGPV